MGYYTDSIIIKATDENRGKSQLIFDEATSMWRDEAERYSDLRSYDGAFRPVSTGQQQPFLQRDEDDDFRGETAPIYPIAAVKTTKSLQKKVAVSGIELSELRAQKFPSYRLTALARAQFGPTVAHAELISAPALRGPVAKSTEGKLVTSYNVIHADCSIASFATVAEARAKALQIMKDDVDGAIGELSIRARITRESGKDTLLVISRPPVDSTLTVKVTFETPDEAKIDSYIVALTYHH